MQPYLAFSVMLAAGLAGIKGKYKLAAPTNWNVYQMTAKERETLDIQQLPSDLSEAIRLAENSELLRECLGRHIFRNLLENKRKEWHEYHARVSQYELDRYLAIL